MTNALSFVNPCRAGIPVQQKWTMARRLAQVGLQQHRPVRRPLLTKLHKKKRLLFCKSVQSWTVTDWRNVIWSDESSFQRHRRDQRQVWRFEGEGLAEDCVSASLKFGGGPGVMIWGAAGGPLRTKILTLCNAGTIKGPDYVKILKSSLIPQLHLRSSRGRQAIFMQDNAKPHTARVTTRYLNSTTLKVLPNWPPNSPDLNPIEAWWGEMKYRLQGKLFSSRDDLWGAVRKAWDDLDAAKIDTLAATMPARVKNCIRAGGGHFHL